VSGLATVVRSGVGRRRVQTVVIALSAFLAVTAAVLAGSLLAASKAPFERSFAAQNGAHLSALFDGGRVTGAQAAATAHAAGVAESAGPFAVVTQTPRLPGGMGLPPLTIAGRDRPGAGVDRVTIVQGRWPSAPGEIAVVDGPGLGDELTFADLPGSPAFTVVGRVRSASSSADAWVVPSAIPSLTSPGSVPGRQMLYRLTAATTTAEIDSERSVVAAMVPAGSLLGSQSWLTLKQAADRNSALFVPFLVAFGLLGVVMAILSVGGVVSGAVGAATLRIGVLKAIGFTPAQVVRAYLGQALIPAGIGIVLGAVVGSVLAVPLLKQTEDVYESSGSGVAPWVGLVVVAVAVAVVAGTAWLAALRAGRLRTADALAIGRAPVAGRGRRAAALSGRLPLPRPVTLGLAQPFARPGRLTAMVATVVFGAASVALAVGLAGTLGLIETARTHDTAPVSVDAFGAGGRFGPGGQVAGPGERSAGQNAGTGTGAAGQNAGAGTGSTGQTAGPGTGPGGQPGSGSAGKQADPLAGGGPSAAKVESVIDAQPGTKASYGMVEAPATLAGVTGEVDVVGYSADPRWAGFEMTEGRWFAGPGEAVAPTPLLTAAGAKIGDTVIATVGGHRIPLRIVGELFSTRNQGMQLFTDLSTLSAAIPDVTPSEYRVAVAPGIDLDAYVNKLNTALQPLGLGAMRNPASHSDVLLALDTLTLFLTVMLVAVAALGILNAVVLQTRERVRELGVHKAIGMTPRQAVTVVLSSVVLVGVVGGVAGVPAGVALHRVLMPAMGASAGIRLPRALLEVYHPWLLLLLAAGGLVIAVVGALLPAGWAARLRTATALRTE